MFLIFFLVLPVSSVSSFSIPCKLTIKGDLKAPVSGQSILNGAELI